MKNKKELPVCEDPIFTAFLEYAFPCSILQTNICFQNLLYVSFFDLYWNNNCDEKLKLYNFNLLDYLLFDSRIIDKSIVDIDNKINNKLKKWIDEDYYIYAFIDEPKLNATQFSDFVHKIHVSLIFGYDDYFNNFSILNFDKNKKFGKISINQKDLKKACLSNVDETKFILLKPSFDVVNVEIKLIEKRLSYYLQGKNIEVGKCRNILSNDYFWGINIYTPLCDYINKNNILDFRLFKLLEEHKVYLYREPLKIAIFRGNYENATF